MSANARASSAFAAAFLAALIIFIKNHFFGGDVFVCEAD
jgi:hypothetical protein